MIYNLVNYWLATLSSWGLGFLRIFSYAEFRAIAALITSFLIVILLGPRTIRWLLAMKIGDNPEFYNQTLNELMKGKKNTPTMGGILIVGAILVSTLLLADLTNFYIHMALLCMVWLATLGGFDDYLKLTSARRKPGSREGLYSWEKMVLQIGLAVVLSLFIHHYGMTKESSDRSLDPNHVHHHIRTMSHSLNLPMQKTWVWDTQQRDWVPNPNLFKMDEGWRVGLFVLLGTLVIVGASNAVNLTDGMDGLASGVMCVVAFAFLVLALLAGWEDGLLAKRLLIPYIRFADELAIVAAAMLGACMGFLWFNCSPAQVFMGDTGSLTLGGLIGYLAVVTRQEFLLLIIGGIFVLEAVSVILQVGYFKATGGKRIFKCAPIHHHFHMIGWPENQVVVRFWLISAILAALALATIKLR